MGFDKVRRVVEYGIGRTSEPASANQGRFSLRAAHGENEDAVFEVLDRGWEASVVGLARQTGLSPEQVRRALKNLAGYDLVERRGFSAPFTWRLKREQGEAE